MVGPYPSRTSQSVVKTRESKVPAVSPPSIFNGVQPGRREAASVVGHEQSVGGSARDVVVSSLALVNDRIIAYEDKLVAWKKLNAEVEKINLDIEQRDKITACREHLQGILDGYNSLHERLLQEGSARSDDVLIQDLFLGAEKDDIGFIESDCQHLLNGDHRTGGWLAGTRSRIVRKTEQDIAQAMASNDNQQVISLYEQLSRDPGQHLPYDMTLNYGRALMRSGREQDAGKIFQGLLAAIRKQGLVRKEFNLMGLIADLQFGLEKYDDAAKSYGELIGRYDQLGQMNDWARLQQAEIHLRDRQNGEVRAYAVLLRGYLGYNPDRDGFKVVLQAERFLHYYPESQIASGVNRILQESRVQAEKWFAGLVEQIERFKVDKMYQEGLLRLAQVSSLELPTDKQKKLRDMQDMLTLAQTNEAEQQRLSLEQAQQEDWKTAQAHLEAKEYDKAIEVFQGLLDTSFAEKAAARIREAIRLAARDERRKAAELFVRAGRAQNPDNKKRLLLTSRQLLQDILVKYPQADIIDKVKRNLQRINDEISAIDHSGM